MRLEYMTSSTPLIKFTRAGRARFRPAPYPSKPHENAANFWLGPHDDPLRDRRILRGSGVRSGHRIHAAVLAAARHRARGGRILGRRDHVVLERRGSALPALLGGPRRPPWTEAPYHPIVRRCGRRAVAHRARAEPVGLRRLPGDSIAP